jgi:hypothetical protein
VAVVIEIETPVVTLAYGWSEAWDFNIGVLNVRICRIG